MPTLLQALEQARGRGQLRGDPTRFRALAASNGLPAASVRAFQASLLGRISLRRPWAVILCRFKGDVDPGNEASIENLYRQMFAPGTGGLVEYWRDVSLGMIDISGSRVFGWVETDMRRAQAGAGSGTTRKTLIDAGIRAAQAAGIDPISGFHSQITVYTRNWSIDGAPAGADWRNPQWAPFWIDGSASGKQVNLTPSHDGNITAHEMGHGFDMDHDLALDQATEYGDPCCIMSQANAHLHPTLNVPFGPSVCLPHLERQEWLYPRRLYVDDGTWMQAAAGVEIPLATLRMPWARANLGARLAYQGAGGRWDYYIEYVESTGWNQGLGAPHVYVRRFAPYAGNKTTVALLGDLAVPATPGVVATLIEPLGNVRFEVERWGPDPRWLKLRVTKL